MINKLIDYTLNNKDYAELQEELKAYSKCIPKCKLIVQYHTEIMKLNLPYKDKKELAVKSWRKIDNYIN